MKKLLWAAGVGLAIVVPSLTAAMIAPQPGPARMAQADILFVGRVVGIEPQDVEVEAFPGAKEKIKLRVAVVQINEKIRGLKDEKSLRVAFYPPPENPGNPNGGIRFPPRGRGTIQLAMGMDGLFALTKHHQDNLYNPPGFANFINREAGNFKQEIEMAKSAGKVLDNPKEALTSKNPEDRFQAAAVMINHYRFYRPAVGHKFEPIDAEQSKLIIKGLLAGDWTPKPRRFDQLDPLQIFHQLGITEKDGYKQPQNVRDQKEYYQSAKQWLEDNQDKYRIQKIVGTDKADNPGGNVNPGELVDPPVKSPIKIRPPIKIKPLPVRPPIRIQPVDPPQIQPVDPPVQIPLVEPKVKPN